MTTFRNGAAYGVGPAGRAKGVISFRFGVFGCQSSCPFVSGKHFMFSSARRAVDHPFLRMPPFPRRRSASISRHAMADAPAIDPAALVAALRAERVGGCFWGEQPPLRDEAIVVAPASSDDAASMLAAARRQADGRPLYLLGGRAGECPADVTPLPPHCDPWHLAGAAAEIHAGADNEIALAAALCNADLRLSGEGRFLRLADEPGRADPLHGIVQDLLICGTSYRDPFTGKAATALDAVAMLSHWRRLIDSNRSYKARFGIAAWKRETVDALLWDGGGLSSGRGRRMLSRLSAGDKALIWRSRTPSAVQSRLARNGVSVAEVEDGFIRSAGLGADCVPPLSIIVDDDGIYFDPAKPSRLEKLIQCELFSPEIVARAKALREELISGGLTKYARSTNDYPRPPGDRKVVLVTGQVEDDRSILAGGAGVTNFELLRRARLCEPDAFIIYKPHPDVEAGHRKGRIPDAAALSMADRIERGAPIAALLDVADALHVITSQAGFEGLMRGKPVTVHGAPFYAGWGLTEDLGPVPARRTERRTLDELVAAALILYPRYLDPVTRLPCPPEVLVQRLIEDKGHVGSPLVYVRRAHGALRRMMAGLRARLG